MTFAQSFRAILVGGTKTVIGLATQTDESVSAPFYLEQARRSLVESLACETTGLGGRPWATGYSSLDVFCLVIITAFSREPLGPVPEVVFAVFRSDEIVDGFTRQCDVR